MIKFNYILDAEKGVEMKNSRRIISFITALAVSSSFVSCKKTEDSSRGISA